MKVLRQKVQLLSKRNTLCYDYVFRCCFQPCLNTNVKGDFVSTISKFQIKRLIQASTLIICSMASS